MVAVGRTGTVFVATHVEQWSVAGRGECASSETREVTLALGMEHGSPSLKDASATKALGSSDPATTAVFAASWLRGGGEYGQGSPDAKRAQGWPLYVML